MKMPGSLSTNVEVLGAPTLRTRGVPSFDPQGCKFGGFLGPQRTTETASFRAADSEIQLILDEDLGSKIYVHNATPILSSPGHFVVS